MAKDKLLQDGKYQHEVNLHFAEYGSYVYCKGYFACANLIAKTLIDPQHIIFGIEDSIDKNSSVFPMLFLYRHYIELSLKSSHERINKLLDTNKKNTIPKIHNLTKLFTEFDKIYTTLLNKIETPSEAKKLLQEFRKKQKILKVINDLDDNSISTRYPKDNNDNQINIELSFIEMQKIHTLFEDLSNLLDYLEG